MKTYLLLDYFNGDSTYYIIKAESEEDAKAKHRSLFGKDSKYYKMSQINIRELKNDIEEIVTTEY